MPRIRFHDPYPVCLFSSGYTMGGGESALDGQRNLDISFSNCACLSSVVFLANVARSTFRDVCL